MQKARVLVVEDESIVAQDIMDSVEEMGHEVVGSAATGADAIEAARAKRPDVILMDIMLRGPMDGIEAAKAIRAERDLPVIYLTAYTDERTLTRAKESSPHAYLVKPFGLNELRVTIEMTLHKHKLEMSLREATERYRLLIEASRAIPWEMDALQMRFTFVGPQAGALLGHAPEGWAEFGKWLLMVPEEHRARVREFYVQSATGADSATNQGVEIEFPIQSATGQVFWLRDTVARTGGQAPALRGFMLDITKRREAELERERYIKELTEALEKIRTLHGLLPICAWCKKIRDDKGYWKQVEVYVEEHSNAEFTHSICPECKSKLEEELGGTN